MAKPSLKAAAVGRAMASLKAPPAAHPEPEPSKDRDAALPDQRALRIKVDRIEADPDQPRKAFDDESLARLADSLASRGQLQPIRVRHKPGSPGRYLIVAGERRWRAAKLAELPELDAILSVTGHSQTREPESLLADQVAENVAREDLAPMDLARALAVLEAAGWTQRRIAEECGLSTSAVTRSLALLALPESVQAHVAEGRIPPATAYEISKAPTPEDRSEIASRAVLCDMTRAAVVEAVRQVNEPPARRPDLPGQRKMFEAPGTGFAPVAVPSEPDREADPWPSAEEPAPNPTPTPPPAKPTGPDPAPTSHGATEGGSAIRYVEKAGRMTFDPPGPIRVIIDWKDWEQGAAPQEPDYKAALAALVAAQDAVRIAARLAVGGADDPFVQATEDDEEDPEPAGKSLGGIDSALLRALHSIENADDRWDALCEKGASDGDIADRLKEEWHGDPGHWTPTIRYRCRGSKPAIWIGQDADRAPLGAPTLSGMTLIHRVRELLEIPQHKGRKP